MWISENILNLMLRHCFMTTTPLSLHWVLSFHALNIFLYASVKLNRYSSSATASIRRRFSTAGAETKTSLSHNKISSPAGVTTDWSFDVETTVRDRHSQHLATRMRQSSCRICSSDSQASPQHYNRMCRPVHYQHVHSRLLRISTSDFREL